MLGLFIVLSFLFITGGLVTIAVACHLAVNKDLGSSVLDPSLKDLRLKANRLYPDLGLKE